MTVLLILLLLVIVGFLGYLIRESCEPPDDAPSDPEAELRAAVELHRIRRRLDASWTKTEQRQDAARLRRQIGQALKEDE